MDYGAGQTPLDNCIGPSAWPLRNPRCTATPYVIDQKGILRLRVSRNIVDHDLEVLCKIVEVDRVRLTEHAANKEDTPDVTQRIWESSRGQTTS